MERYQPWSGSATAPRLALDEGIGDFADRIDPHALFLEIFADRRQAALAPDAGALVAAERREIADRAIGVDPDGASLQPLRHGEGRADVLRPYPGGEPVLRVVG